MQDNSDVPWVIGGMDGVASEVSSLEVRGQVGFQYNSAEEVARGNLRGSAGYLLGGNLLRVKRRDPEVTSITISLMCQQAIECVIYHELSDDSGSEETNNMSAFFN